jgi:sarcosine oxidase
MVEMQAYDVAVVGLGAMGSAALYAAARRGLRVIGFDRLEPGHNRSSSFGESRVIRLAYFEHPSYVPLLRGAYRAWRDLEVATGERVLTITGIVEAGYPGAALVEGSVRSAREHDLPHELLSPRQVNDRFPAFNLPTDWDCVVQPDGGVLFPEKAIGLFVAAAQDLGASVRLTRPCGKFSRWAIASRSGWKTARRSRRGRPWSRPVRGFQSLCRSWVSA